MAVPEISISIYQKDFVKIYPIEAELMRIPKLME